MTEGLQLLRFGGYMLLLLAVLIVSGALIAGSGIWVAGIPVAAWGVIYVAVGVALDDGDS